ncbi:MAG: cytidylate kinase [Candidatus Marinimicrobia bacterium]|nr:cytidylate kinase [Candidatus Neomarinimicrobiota bacterium]
MIIAIDGPAASGKSTTSRGVATRMGITYLDTGAMYRAITLGLMEHGVSFKALGSITEFLDTVNIYFGDSNSGNKIFLNDRSVTDQIRSSTVTEKVSEVSAINVVRDSMVQIQREIADNTDCVLEGRDIGTVVFPNADFKFFLVAGLEIRALRRQKDLNKIGEKKTIDEIKADIRLRDELDTNRDNSPLLKAKDAIEIDTGLLTVDEQIDKIVSIIKQ